MAAAGLILVSVGAASAATFKSLHDFYPFPEGVSVYTGLTAGPDGAFYGVSKGGGVYSSGVIFRVTSAGVFKVLHSFTPEDGTANDAPLVLAPDGKLYGITYPDWIFPGTQDAPGILFSITPSGTYQKIHVFGNGDGISGPYGKLACINNYIYGVTLDDTIFRISTSGVTTVLHQLNTATEGDLPQGLTYGPGGAFYAFCSSGGSKGGGTILKVSPAGAVTVLHSFNPGEHDYWPAPLAVGPDGNLWGIFYASQTDYSGSVFKITPTGTFTTVASDLSNIGFSLAYPLVTKGDSVYGEAMSNDGGFGRIYKVTKQGAVSIVYSFDGLTANSPLGGLVVGNDGGLYGTANYDPSLSPAGQGKIAATAFKVTDAGAFTLLHAMPIKDGWSPPPGLVANADGSLYGVSLGGKYESGMLYKMSSTGVITDIFDFDMSGFNVQNLIKGPDGNLYGTTLSSIFKAVPGSQPTTIYRADSGTNFHGRLTVGSNGFIYGLLQHASSNGVTNGVFRINTAGAFVQFGSFPTPTITTQIAPTGDASVYGVSPTGPSGNGAIFKFTKTGVFSYVYSFPTSSSPMLGLTLGADGKLYGIMRAGTPGIFSFNPQTSQVTLVHAFNGAAEGLLGTSFLTPGPDGSLYGTIAKGTSGGAVYAFNPATKLFSVLGGFPPYIYQDSPYYDPSISLAFGPSGKLYGTIPYGGVHKSGQVFSFN